MKAKLVPSKWLERDGCRLDSSPYLSGAVEARLRLQELSAKKHPLEEITRGGRKGIFNGPRFARTYVDQPEHGVPFLGSTDILAADLSGLAFLSKKQVAAREGLLIDEGWTLITCSGTIGRMVFSRPDMKGMAGSQHFMRVVPDTEKVRPGYLFAFLRSKFGVPLVLGGTYGAIIQHIEPQHIATLPVPIAPSDVQSAAHSAVVDASKARVQASRLIVQAIHSTATAWGIEGQERIRRADVPSPDIVVLDSSQLAGRFDAFFHSTGAARSDALIRRILTKSVGVRPLGEIAAEVFETPRFGRIPVEDPRYGTTFMSISDLARIDPDVDALISTRQVEAMRARVKAGWLILPRVGQLQGLFGHVVCVAPHLDGVAVSDNNIRIVPQTRDDSGYLFAALSTDVCYWQVIRRACGTSIPYLDSTRVLQVPIPWPGETQRREIAKLVNSAMDMRSEAVRREREAVHLVEQWIESGGRA